MFMCCRKDTLFSFSVVSFSLFFYLCRKFKEMKKKTVFTILGILVLVGFVLLYVFGPVMGEMPLWMSILPPLVAIVMALLIKEVLLSLFLAYFRVLSSWRFMRGAVPSKPCLAALCVSSTHISSGRSSTWIM